jgi:hypothetical protein
MTLQTVRIHGNRRIIMRIFIIAQMLSLLTAQNLQKICKVNDLNEIIINEMYFDKHNEYVSVKESFKEILFENNRLLLFKMMNENSQMFFYYENIAKILVEKYNFVDPHEERYFMEDYYNMVRDKRFLTKIITQYYKNKDVMNIKINKITDSSTLFPTVVVNSLEILPFLRHISINNINEIKNLSFSIDNGEFLGNEFFYYVQGNHNEVSVLEMIPNLYPYGLDEAINVDNKNISVSTSSNLSEKYCASNMLDFDLNTTWSEGNKNSGKGEWISLELEEETELTALLLFSGYAKSEELYYANARIKQIELHINDKKVGNYVVEDGFYPKQIPINQKANKLKLVIIDVYHGSKYHDCCVSELMLIKKPKKSR